MADQSINASVKSPGFWKRLRRRFRRSVKARTRLRRMKRLRRSVPHSRPLLYWSAVLIWLITVSLLLLWSLGFNLETLNFKAFTAFEELSIVQLLVLVVTSIWIVTSVKIIQLDQIAGVTVLGIAARNVGPGPALVPLGVTKTRVYKTNVQQKQFPGNPEEVFGGHDHDPLPPDKKRALRIPTGYPDDPDSANPLNIQLVVGFIYYLRIRINDALAFLIQYGDIDEFWRQMNDTGDRVLTRRVSDTKGAAELIHRFKDLMDEMQSGFQEHAKNGGVEIVESGLYAPNLSHDLSKAIRNIGIAKANANITKTAAAAEKVRLQEEGVGRADAEAALIAAIKAEYEDADDQVKATYAAEKALNDKTVILGADGIAQVFGLGKAIFKDNPNGGSTNAS